MIPAAATTAACGIVSIVVVVVVVVRVVVFVFVFVLAAAVPEATKAGFQGIQLPGEMRADAAVLFANHVKAGNGVGVCCFPPAWMTTTTTTTMTMNAATVAVVVVGCSYSE